jgi:hypothetical protein
MRGYARPPDAGENRGRQRIVHSVYKSRHPLPPLLHASPRSHHVCSEACVGDCVAVAGQNTCESTTRVVLFYALQVFSLIFSRQDVDASSWLEIRRCVDGIWTLDGIFMHVADTFISMRLTRGREAYSLSLR